MNSALQRKCERVELDERKLKILQAIVRNYLETGEPVGSRTISKYTDLSLSPATIRNEMADLEEMGLIEQPHTSAGRIPTDRGYRIYVDRMLAEKDREVEEMKELLLEKEERIDDLLKQAAKLLAVNTNYATMISAPSHHRNKLKFIQLSRVDSAQLLAVIVTEGNVIKNHVISTSEFIDDETMLKLNILLNTNLNGLSIEDINLSMISTIKRMAGIHSGIVGDVIDALGEAIHSDEDLEIYTSGTGNILKYPELADRDRAGELLHTFEDKAPLNELAITSLAEPETGIRVYIGEESPVESLRDCSVVTATYEIGDGVKGTIGIVGPKRMDYDKVVVALKGMMSQFDSIFKKG